ncbi:hypothetical protein OPV22_008253 [Ensete ventricosum]|uniref:Uncharacterized protein n=1 Tax=Ensete ventricosum TaxID=4639 RepID=A0AAV8R674_ENSVE|nr:hypothetical protein OPV22_008253 [Ensete ventricosum]
MLRMTCFANELQPSITHPLTLVTDYTSDGIKIIDRELKMDSVALKMATVLFLLLLLLLSATAPSESFAGHRKEWSLVSVPHGAMEKSSSKNDVLHHRFLTVRTNDYGAYDPSPALNKPPYKLINN